VARVVMVATVLVVATVLAAQVGIRLRYGAMILTTSAL